jgi:hypothetical protein
MLLEKDCLKKSQNKTSTQVLHLCNNLAFAMQKMRALQCFAHGDGMN